MSSLLQVAAIDLGATSGRVELLGFDGQRLSLAEAHRFANGPARVHDTLHWDALRLWSEIKSGLAKAGQFVRGADGELISVGVDTWGVDFALLDARGDLLANPVCYWDRRTEGMLDAAVAEVGREAIFEATGLQFLPLNTLYQLLALARQRSPLLDCARSFLMLPDLFGNWLAGSRVAERTEATTTQFFDPRQGDWARPLLDRLGIPTYFLPEVVPPGTVLGELLPSVAGETGLAGVTVVAPASHDTASAVAAVPFPGGAGDADGRIRAYISSGTWSLVGAELAAPLIDARVLRANFTNEGGAGGRVRFLKNVAGLWIVEECRRAWARAGRETSHEEIARLVAAAPALRSFVDVDALAFAPPADMPAVIRAECARTGQPIPVTEGEVLRCALESLALRYRWVLGTLGDLLQQRIEAVHIVGGGSRNAVLCQMTADATGLPVLAGPAEATAIGNGLVQLIARGEIGSLGEGRVLVARSFEPIEYRPRATAAWSEAFGRYQRIYQTV